MKHKTFKIWAGWGGVHLDENKCVGFKERHGFGDVSGSDGEAASLLDCGDADLKKKTNKL